MSFLPNAERLRSQSCVASIGVRRLPIRSAATCGVDRLTFEQTMSTGVGSRSFVVFSGSSH